jgi:Xaa-Pro aminopeptidase
MGLIPREGEPRLLISMSSRDVPAMKLMTWFPDVMSGWNWESAFDPWLARFDGDGPIEIGGVGLDLMRPPLAASLQKSLGNRGRLHTADDALAAVRTLRPRELSQIRAASRLVQTAAAAIVEPWRQGMGVEAAALEGERTARLMAAQDVRTLVSLDGGRTLVPFRGAFEPQADRLAPLAGYIAVKHMGYWADLFVTGLRGASGIHQRADAGLRALLELAKPGAGASDLFASAAKELGPYQLHPVLSGSVGRRLGLSLNEGGEIRHDSRHTLAPGDVYSLHVGACDPQSGGALTSAMVAITATGSDILHLSPAPNVQ